MLSLAEIFPERVPQVLPWTHSTKKYWYAHSGFAAPPPLLLALGGLALPPPRLRSAGCAPLVRLTSPP